MLVFCHYNKIPDVINFYENTLKKKNLLFGFEIGFYSVAYARPHCPPVLSSWVLGVQECPSLDEDLF